MATALRPPGPAGHFLVGNLPEFGKDVLGFFASCARDYGDMVSLDMAGRRAFFLNHPDLIEHVFVTDHRNFIKHSWFWRHVTAIFGSGLLTSEGDFWLRQRRLAQPAFHKDRIAAYAETMSSYSETMLDGWRDGETRDIHQDMMHLTLLIVAKVLFNTNVASKVEEVGAALDATLVEIAVRFRRPVRIPDAIPIPGNVRYRRAVRLIDEVVYRIIDEHRDGSGEGDLLSTLMAVRDEHGRPMTDEQIRDEAITLLLAGHETTALVLSWTFYLLHLHPEVGERLAAEAEQVLGTRMPGAEDVRTLRYTESVILESMRLYPPAYAIGREAVSDCTIGGFDVPAGATLFVSPWVIQRDPRWFDNPEAFEPDRWADGLEKRLPKFAYFPFGGGPRLCIGKSFAMMELVLVLACIARRFRLELDPTCKVAPFASITLRPAHGMQMKLVRR